VKVYEDVLDFLVGSGVRLYAGMVGSTTAPYVSGLTDRAGTRYIPVRHEQVAAAIVDAASRLEGRPSCLLIHGGSGALAASLGIAAAGMDGTPMFVLSATQERVAMERGYWQTTDVLRPMAGFVKYQTRVERPDRAVEAVRRALHETVSGRTGVAQVDIPIDVSAADYEGTSIRVGAVPQVPAFRPLAAAHLVERVGALLAESVKPVILIGGGAYYSGAGAEILRLAERLRAPVVDTPTSRGVVPEDHELSLGPSGILGYEPIGEAIKQADLILAIGSRLSDLQLARTQLVPEGVPIVQVDLEPAVVGQNFDLEVGIAADARSFAEQLNAHLDVLDLPVPEERRVWVKERIEAVDDWQAAWFASAPDNGKVQPQEVVRSLWDQLPRDAILTHGAGDHGFYGYMVPVASPGAHLVSARLGALGCALGYAMGAKLVRPEQTVVACVGDGELMLQIGDLETMARENVNAVVVVFNNFRLGSQRKRVESYGSVQGTDHTNPDFAQLAELMGCKGYRVDTPGQFDAALADALACGRPAVIDVLIDPEARPPRIAMSREAR
jgi:thiamine pyrophosphate-dependent acetolactate synthase large subunit-like protein